MLNWYTVVETNLASTKIENSTKIPDKSRGNKYQHKPGTYEPI